MGNTQITKPVSFYEITLARYRDHPKTIPAASPAKAKYLAWLDVSECYENFEDFLHDVESVHRVYTPFQQPVVAEVFERRGIPFAHIGMSVEVGGRRGVIAGVNASDNLDVTFEDGSVGNCHPTWNITYFVNDNETVCYPGN